MKTFVLQVLATLVALMIFFFVAACAFVFLLMLVGAAAAPMRPVADNAVLTFDLSEPINDRGGVENPLVAFAGGPPSALRLATVVEALREAASDESIRALFLHGSVGGTWAQLRELRAALLEFRASGKPIVAWFDQWSEGEFYLASAGDRTRIAPIGFFDLDGLAAQVVYFGAALEKLGVEVQVMRVGRYKSATEPFVQNEMSPENREQLESLLGDVYGTFLEECARSRGITAEDLRQIARTRVMLSSEEAVEARVVDEIATFDQVLDELKELAGADRDASDVPQTTLRAYARGLDRSLDRLERGSRNHVAVVYAQGNIVDGESYDEVGGATFARELRRLRHDDDVKAVVIRVDSPGGSVVASEEIRAEVRRLKAEGKTVVASMGGVAASGGYWISASADAIVAQPNTITGSIGVFGLWANGESLLDRLGLDVEVVRTEPHADARSIARRKSDDELALAQRHVDRLYDQFVELVARGRGLETAFVEQHAQGRVFSGARALELGFVDELGGLDRAIAIAAERAGIADDHVVSYPPKEEPFEQLMNQLIEDQEGQPVSRALSLPPRVSDLVDTLRSTAQQLARSGWLARMPFDVAIR